MVTTVLTSEEWVMADLDILRWSFGLGFGSYSPWGFGGMGMGYGMFNNYYNWNSFYNPYYGGYHPGIIVINNYNGKTNPSGYTTTRKF